MTNVAAPSINLSIVPLGHRLLVELEEVEEVSKGGILIPESRERNATRTIGTIVAIGPNCWKAFDDGTPWAAIGDKVIFSKYDGKRIKDPDHPERDYQVLNDDDIQVKYVGQEINEHEIPDEDIGA